MSRLYFMAPRSLPYSKATPASSGTGSCVREGRLMGHHLHCDLADTTNRQKVVGLRKVRLRERLARLILGETATVTVIVQATASTRSPSPTPTTLTTTSWH